jgi:transcriptional regulator with PAS, ATPase and Fis domain
VDVRVIGAAGDLGTQRLRQDLLARLGAEPIRLPSLRDRREDIGMLVHHFLGSLTFAISGTGFLALCLHDWPGNVRELEKVISEGLVFAAGRTTIGLEHLPAALAENLDARRTRALRIPRRTARPAPTRDQLAELLTTHHGRVASVALELDRHWPVVWRWLRRYRLDPDAFRKGR